MKHLINKNEVQNELISILSSEIDDDLERDMLEFIDSETAVEVQDLIKYFHSISYEDILYWLKEYEAKWNPSCQLFHIVIEEIKDSSLLEGL